MTNAAAADVDGYGNGASFRNVNTIATGPTGCLIVGSKFRLRSISLLDTRVTTVLGNTQLGAGYGKASLDESVQVDVWVVASGAAASDSNLVGQFELAAGARDQMAGINVAMASGDHIVARASAPGVVIRALGNEVT